MPVSMSNALATFNHGYSGQSCENERGLPQVLPQQCGRNTLGLLYIGKKVL